MAVQDDLRALLATCLNRRSPPSTFRYYYEYIDDKESITEQDVIEVFMKNSSAGRGGAEIDLFDPLELRYIVDLSLSEPRAAIGLGNLLRLTAHTSSTKRQALLHLLGKSLDHSDPKVAQGLPKLVSALPEFLSELGTEKFVSQTTQNPISAPQTEDLVALGTFVLKLLPIASQTSAASELCSARFASAFTNFLNYLGSVHGPLAADLRSAYSVLRPDGSAASTDSDNSVARPARSSAPSPHVSRVQRLLWLLTCSYAHLRSDAEILAQFETFLPDKRPEVATTELIRSCFDALAVALVRQESPQATNFWKTLTLKRLPLLIGEQLGPQLGAANLEHCITTAMQTLDSKTLALFKAAAGGDSFDELFAGSATPAVDFRSEFIRSFIQLGLLPPQSFPRITEWLRPAGRAEEPLPLPTDDGAERLGLPAEIEPFLRSAAEANPEFIPLADSGLMVLFAALDRLSAAKQQRTACITVELIEQFVARHDSARLRRLCLALALNPAAGDVVASFYPAGKLFTPLVTFLDEWDDDEADANFQDAYADFGCVFLFVVFFLRRWGVPLADISRETSTETERGTGRAGAFLAEFLGQLGEPWPVADLGPARGALLGDWLGALFDQGGISDDLMRRSSAKDCFRLVPTIFQQALGACRTRHMELDTLKGGLEYFLQPFLLGTLVGAFAWLQECLWRRADVPLVVQTVRTLALPVDLSGDAPHIHRLVLAVSGPGLHAVLSEFADGGAGAARNAGVDEELLEVLRGAAELGGAGTVAQRHAWSHTVLEVIRNSARLSCSRGGPSSERLLVFLADEVRNVAMWLHSLNMNHNLGPPLYDAALLQIAVELLGPRAVLTCLLAEIHRTQTEQLGKQRAAARATARGSGGTGVSLSGMQAFPAVASPVSSTVYVAAAMIATYGLRPGAEAARQAWLSALAAGHCRVAPRRETELLEALQALRDAGAEGKRSRTGVWGACFADGTFDMLFESVVALVRGLCGK